jgi:hypothetical protein
MVNLMLFNCIITVLLSKKDTLRGTLGEIRKAVIAMKNYDSSNNQPQTLLILI